MDEELTDEELLAAIAASVIREKLDPDAPSPDKDQ